MKNVVCIGSALKDVFIPTGDGVVIETPEDVLSQRKLSFELGAKYYIEHRYSATGGCALNISMGLARLGISATPYALIGGDTTGEWIRQTMQTAGVNTSLLRQVSEVDSDLSMILVDRKTGDRVIFVNHNMTQELVIDASVVPRDGVVFIGSMKGKWTERFAQLRTVLSAQNCVLAYNPGQGNITQNVAAVVEMVGAAEYLFLNKDEAAEIVLRGTNGDEASIDDIKYLLAQLRTITTATIVMTAGLEGAWIAGQERTVFVPSNGQRPVDTTGAGDAFSSGVLAALLHDHDIDTAAAWGALNAGNVVKFYGSNKGLLDHTHITQAQSQVRDKVAVV